MGFWVYMLRCADNSYYTGHTDDLEKRLAEHYDGECGGYTSTRLPVKLVYSEEFGTRKEALACERQIKGWRRKQKEALIRGDWEEISRLGKKVFEKIIIKEYSRCSYFDGLGMNGNCDRIYIDTSAGNVFIEVWIWK